MGGVQGDRTLQEVCLPLMAVSCKDALHSLFMLFSLLTHFGRERSGVAF